MNELLINIISVVVTVVVIPLISILGTKLIKWINTKINNTKTADMLTTATTIVFNAVRAVFQTYVESLKVSGEFSTTAQQTALKKAKQIALEQMTSETKTYITETFGNVDTWINTQIESTINALKNK